MKELITGFNGKYILNEKKEAVPCTGVVEWGMWMEAQRQAENGGLHRVGLDEVNGLMISTVFLGLDHNFLRDGEPILFETMFFGPGGRCVEVSLDDEDCTQLRYCTWEQAENAHKKIVTMLKANPVTQDQQPRLEAPDE